MRPVLAPSGAAGGHPAPVLTKEQRERLVAIAAVQPNYDSGVAIRTIIAAIDALEAESESRFAQVAAAGVRVLELEAERDALAAKVAELEGKALAYDDAHQGDFHERAHKLARWDAKDIGRNVWHIAVEHAEKAEAKVAVLAEEVKAWRGLDDHDHAFYALRCPSPTDTMVHGRAARGLRDSAMAARAATDASGALNG